MSAVDPVPELVEQAFDQLDRISEQLGAARNATAEATHHMLAARDVLLRLRAATSSVELTEHPDEINLVMPTPEALASQRRRQAAVAVWLFVVLVLVVAVVLL